MSKVPAWELKMWRDRLQRNGQQLVAGDRDIVRLGALYKPGEGKRRKGIQVDRRALLWSGHVYAGRALHPHLQEIGVYAQTPGHIIGLLHRYDASPRLVWGFSGFASPGFPYELEMTGIELLLDLLEKKGQKPDAIVGGGVSDGIPAIAANAAMRRHIPAIGFAPLEGLSAVAPHDHLVIKGATYEDREQFVAMGCDVLTCWNGKDGTRRECQKALAAGSVVVLIAPKGLDAFGPTSFPATFRRYPDIRAQLGRRFLVCTDLAKLPEVLAKAIRNSKKVRLRMRNPRLKALGARLMV